MMINQKTSTLLESDEFIDLCNALEENYHNFDCEDDNDIDPTTDAGIKPIEEDKEGL